MQVGSRISTRRKGFDMLRFRWLSWLRGEAAPPQAGSQLVRRQGRDVRTIQVRFITRQESLSDLVDFANEYSRETTVQSGEFRPIKISAKGTSDRLLHQQRNWIAPKIAAIQETRMLETDSSRPRPTTVQWKIFENKDLEELERAANRFCLTVEATHADIQVDEDTGEWAVIITYGIRP